MCCGSDNIIINGASDRVATLWTFIGDVDAQTKINFWEIMTATDAFEGKIHSFCINQNRIDFFLHDDDDNDKYIKN